MAVSNIKVHCHHERNNYICMQLPNFFTILSRSIQRLHVTILQTSLSIEHEILTQRKQGRNAFLCQARCYSNKHVWHHFKADLDLFVHKHSFIAKQHKCVKSIMKQLATLSVIAKIMINSTICITNVASCPPHLSPRRMGEAPVEMLRQ